jgi:DNA-binding MarR family transcriptional regulator
LFVAVLVTLPAKLDAQLQRQSGMSHFEYGIISNLSEAPGRQRRLSELAQLANGSLSRLSHTITRLEGRGWVERVPCPGDGRLTNAVLTDSGYDAVVAAAPSHVDQVRELVFERISETQRRQLQAICRTLLADRP